MRPTMRLLAASTLALAMLPAHASSGLLTTASATLGDVGIQSVSYSHLDCVGPGLPLTPVAHATHTDFVAGFVPGVLINFALSTLNPFGAGICPTTLSGPVLEEDFTGTYRMTAVCRRAQNDGAVFLDWQISAIAGIVQSQGSNGTPCVSISGSPLALDVTIAISPVSLLFLTLAPVGGVKLTITQ